MSKFPSKNRGGADPKKPGGAARIRAKRTIAERAGADPKKPGGPLEPYPGLTLKQSRFVDAYLGAANGNGTRAILMAGYEASLETARRLSYIMLGNPDIQACLQRVMGLHGLSAEQTVYRLSLMAMVSIDDFLTIGPDGAAKVDLTKARETGAIHLIESITFTDAGPRITLPKRAEILGLLAKYHGLLIDRSEVYVKHDSEGLRAEILAKLREIAPQGAPPGLMPPGKGPQRASAGAGPVIDISPRAPQGAPDGGADRNGDGAV